MDKKNYKSYARSESHEYVARLREAHAELMRNAPEGSALDRYKKEQAGIAVEDVIEKLEG